MVKDLPVMRETWGRSLGWEDPLEKGRLMLPTLLFCPGEFHGQRRLAGYSLQGLKESEMAETFTSHMHMCIQML